MKALFSFSYNQSHNKLYKHGWYCNPDLFVSTNLPPKSEARNHANILLTQQIVLHAQLTSVLICRQIFTTCKYAWELISVSKMTVLVKLPTQVCACSNFFVLTQGSLLSFLVSQWWAIWGFASNCICQNWLTSSVQGHHSLCVFSAHLKGISYLFT